MTPAWPPPARRSSASIAGTDAGASCRACSRRRSDQPDLPAGRRAALLFEIGEIQLEKLSDEEAALASYSNAIEQQSAFLARPRGAGRPCPPAPGLGTLAGGDAAAGRRGLCARAEGRRRVQDRRALRDADRAAGPGRAVLPPGAGDPCAARAGHERDAAPPRRRGTLARSGRAATGARSPPATTTATSAGLLKQAGRLWEERLSDPARAMECYEQALALDGEDLEALDALARLSRRAGPSERLAGFYERLAHPRQGPRPRRLPTCRRRRAFSRRSATAKQASRLYEQVRELQPDEPGALEALGPPLQRAPAPGGARPPVRGAEPPRGRRRDARRAAARARRAARRVRQIWPAPARLWSRRPACPRTGSSPASCAARASVWASGTSSPESLEREADLGRDRGFRVEALSRAAMLYQDHLQDPDRAASVLTRVLELDPFHEEAALRLEQILVKRGSWTELVEVLRRRLEAAAVGARPATGSAVQAQIRASLPPGLDPARALAAACRGHRHPGARPPPGPAPSAHPAHARRAAPGSRAVAGGSRRLRADRGGQRRPRRAAVRAPSARRPLGRQARRRAPRHLLAYQNAVAIAPGDAAVLAQLFELFNRDQDWENAAEVLGRLLEIETEPRLLVAHFSALAEIQEKGLGDPRLAAESLRQALASRPRQLIHPLARLEGGAFWAAPARRRRTTSGLESRGAPVWCPSEGRTSACTVSPGR